MNPLLRALSLGPAVLFLGLGAAPAPAEGAGRLRAYPRRGSPAGGEILRIRGPGAASALRVWFGDAESPGIAPGSGDSLSVIVPPGASGARVALRVECPGGAGFRRVRSFRYAREKVGPAVFSGCGRVVAGEGGAFLEFEVLLRSRARRLAAGGWRYEYRAENMGAGPLEVRWKSLEHAGFPGGWTVSLAPWAEARVEVTASAGPAEVAAGADIVGGAGCAGAQPDGNALVPSSNLPFVPAPDGAAFAPGMEGGGTLTWAHPDPAGVDGFTVLLRRADLPGRLPQVFEAPAGATSRTVPAGRLGAGLNSLSVRARKDGILSSAAILGVVREP